MKYIKQHEEIDCGAACLSMIASHYGLFYSLSKYREITKTNKNGTNLHGLVDGASKIGLKGTALSGTPIDLKKGIENGEIHFPFIAHTLTAQANQHFVVVSGFKNGKYIIGDPQKGKIKLSEEDFINSWTGYIVTFETDKTFKKGNHTKGDFKKFFSLLKGQYRILFFVFIISIVVSMLGILGAFVFETVMDNFYSSAEAPCEEDCDDEHEHIEESSVQNENNNNILENVLTFINPNANNYNVFFIMVIALYLLQGLIQFLRGYLMSILSKNIDLKLMLSYYNHIIDLPIETVNSRNTGEYLSRFSDASTIRTAVSGATLTLLLDSIMVLVCAFMLFFQNKILFLVALIMILLYGIIVLCYRKPIEKINRDVMQKNALVQSYLKESIDGIETVKSNSAEKTVKEKSGKFFNGLIKSVFKNNVITFSQDSLCDIVEMVGTAIILWIGFGMVFSNIVSVGQLLTFYVLLAYFTTPIKNLIELQPMMQTAIIAADRLNDILNVEPESVNSGKSITKIDGCIDFKNVSFRYGNNELTLKNITLTIAKGEKVAIVGESGSGKTTLAKLLLKFYEPEKGSITIDGVDLSQISINNIRSNIAYVDQNTFLFSDTVMNNLKLSAPETTDDDVISVCKMVKADKFISKLPFGYNTYLDENGKNLSGGQKQRISIARALIKKPSILILDEATSNLDTVTESSIKDTIFSLSEDITCIIIAHRLSTISKCDKIIVMDNGKVIGVGTHDELIKSNRIYKSFCESM